MNLEREPLEQAGDPVIEYGDPPLVPPKVSAAMRAAQIQKRRRVPHHKSLLGILMLGGLVAGAGFFGLKRVFR